MPVPGNAFQHGYRTRSALSDACQIVAIQGYVGTHTIALPAPPTNGAPTVATLTVISRLGKKRAGTRFNTRGVDDEGNCANFVEVDSCFFVCSALTLYTDGDAV
jgi:hypothetical protein